MYLVNVKNNIEKLTLVAIQTKRKIFSIMRIKANRSVCV